MTKRGNWNTPKQPQQQPATQPSSVAERIQQMKNRREAADKIGRKPGG